MTTTLPPTASTPPRILGVLRSQLSARTTRLDDECATTGGTGGLCVHCTGPESD